MALHVVRLGTPRLSGGRPPHRDGAPATPRSPQGRLRGPGLLRRLAARACRLRPTWSRGRSRTRGPTSVGRPSPGRTASRCPRRNRGTSSSCSRQCRTRPTCPSAATARTNPAATARCFASFWSRPERTWRSDLTLTELALARPHGICILSSHPLTEQIDAHAHLRSRRRRRALHADRIGRFGWMR